MTQEFNDMLLLLGSAVHGISISQDHEYNIKRIKELAESQGVWSLVCPELEKNVDIKGESMQCMMMVAKNIQRNEYNLNLMQDLDAEGIDYCLLKGQAVAEIYPYPDYRISGDTDILIKPKDEKKTIVFLKRRGYQVKKRTKNDHHLKAYHSIGKLLEIHINLNSTTTRELLLDGLNPCHEPRRQILIYGKKIWTLGYNDGLLYLTAHYINHLIGGGGGIRQMLDLLLYMEKYESKIDMDQYKQIVKKLKYDGLIDIIKTIGAKYMGFSYPIKNEDLAEKLLSDCEEGGIFGFKTDTRKGFYQAYCKRRSGHQLHGNWILAVKRESTLLNKFFAYPYILKKEGYSYAKHKLLVPVAWLHRAFDISTRKVKEKETRNNNIEKRMKLMSELHMIDE